MTVIDIHTNAHATFVAMAKGLSSTNTTKSTVIAVEGLLAFRHPQVTDVTVVSTKLNITSYTAVRCWLSRLALLANDLSDSESIHGTMPRWRHFVVTNPTPKNFPTAWRNDVALSFVVYTAHGLIRQTMRRGRTSGGNWGDQLGGGGVDHRVGIWGSMRVGLRSPVHQCLNT